MFHQAKLDFTLPKPPDDICRNRHQGNPESEAANLQTNKARDRAKVIAHITAQGARGSTCEELSVSLGLRYTTASARCSELKADGVIVTSGERRPTQTGSMAAVLVLAPK
jgi:hypothetical protein